MKGSVEIGAPRIAGNKVTFPLRVSGVRARRIIRGDFWCEYTFDPAPLPTSVLAISPVANLLPIAWLEDLDVSAPTLDADFVGAIPAIQSAWSAMYPELDVGGALSVDRVEAFAGVTDESAAVVLYSGGADSTATALNHASEKVTLCAIWGIDVGVDNAKAWAPLRVATESFARTHGFATSPIRSNLRRFVDDRVMDDSYGAVTGNWWRATVGLVLPAMAAPVAVAAHASRVYVASSHTSEFGFAHGTHPTIDEHVRFAGVRTFHDGYEMTRQDKLRLIAARAPGQTMLCCVAGAAQGSGNCMRCMKCLRTAAGLTLVGADPRAHGFSATAETFALTRHLLESGGFDFNHHEEFYLRQVHQAAGQRQPLHFEGAEGFFAWLVDQDIPALRARTSRKSDRARLRRPVGRRVPHRIRPLARRIYLALFKRW